MIPQDETRLLRVGVLLESKDLPAPRVHALIKNSALLHSRDLYSMCSEQPAIKTGYAGIETLTCAACVRLWAEAYGDPQAEALLTLMDLAEPR